MPWKNGGGTTREIFRLPKDGDWNFRLSIAEVKESGPFSIFNGFMRHLLLLTGNGMILQSKNDQYVMNKASVPYTFSGEVSINAELISGPNTDFNVFWDRNLYQCEIEVIKTRTTLNISTDKDELTFIYSTEDDSCFYFSDHEEKIEVKENSILINLKKI